MKSSITVTIGFTGTSKGMTISQREQLGMTISQREQLSCFLSAMFKKGYRIFRHGGCIGADAQAARIAKDIGFYLIEHTGLDPRNLSELPRTNAGVDFNDEVLPGKPFLVRDHDIVDASHFLLAAPDSEKERLRSGTWATVRYAQKRSITVAFVYPGFATSPMEIPEISVL